ncbi:MAG: SUMF1/EgtB/PvdO family nonheme iron enzyme, partial [Thermoguttaceae bacterium]|nr:SUMF1/EgtB/PvdO family nonheme iron enzyme [Thermoguttaceae bacterium]
AQGDATKAPNSGIAFMPDEEARAHRVKITRDFWIMQSQVSIAAFACFLQTTKRAVPKGAIGYDKTKKELKYGDEYSFLAPGFPDFSNGGDVLCPATCVDWSTAVAFCDWLNEEFRECRPTGARFPLTFRLPTKAEWERACRAGSRTDYHFGRNAKLLPNYGNYDDAAPATNLGNDGVDFLAQANQYKPNKWGLYHMCGNVWEWCADWYAPYENGRRAVVDPHGPSRGVMRTARGGAWNTAPVFCRSGARAAAPPWRRSVDLGFRVVMDILE